MPSILSKNCVTAGVVDFYCLVCSEHFLHEVKVFEHLSKEKHKGALRATDCYEKFKEDFITKIKSLYYCKLCDQTFKTIFKVKLHVSEDQHLLKKQNEAKLIKRQDNNIVVFGEVLLTSDAWNGIIDDTCLLCNVEFEEPAHINEEEHVLNLIRNKIVFDGSFVYRQMGDTLHQCLTCNQIVTEDALVTHINTTSHKDSYKTNQDEHKETINKITVNEKCNETNNKAIPNATDKSNESDLVNFIDKYREQKINLNLIDKTAICKICSTNIEFNKDVIEEHIKKHNSTNGKSSVNKKPRGTIEKGSQCNDNDPLQIAKQHGLMQYEDKFYCKPCHCFIPSAIKNLKIHISSNEHYTKTIEQKNRPKVLDKNSKVSMKELNEEGAVNAVIFKIPGETEAEAYCVIRDKYFMLTGSFSCLVMYDKRHLFCQLCEEKCLADKLNDHMNTEKHLHYMECIQLITAVEGEVIRQITNGIYHCGYCSSVESDWHDMLLHITTDGHYRRKMKIKLISDEYEANKKTHIDYERFLSLKLSRVNNFFN